MDTSIRKALKAELPIIRRLALDIWPATYSSILSQEQLAYMLELFYSDPVLEKDFDKPGYSFFLLEQEGKDTGFAGLELKEDQTAHLHKIYLSPDHQGKGLGKKMIQFIIDFAKNAGAHSLTLHVNRYNKALQFYQAVGFEIIKELDTEIGNGYLMNDYVMKKDL
ncbi:GNAT family N-acetyltransferase [Niabella yanshanensis]|uniref:GNAT family N-acetyltransferase n=1 Tax=Niabella yanshanensis TaxID=577386 RepID=A0ABZ0WAR0_9BACT|nr:GNAT family N-acetyltransferase [Niabella yanshanensis]WQD38642.1 GNAT family N-acetyltransferase [Niabella yanshanensis]